MNTLITHALLAIVVGVVAFIGGLNVGTDHVVAQTARDAHTAQVAYEASQKAAAAAISKIEVKHVTVQGKVREIVRENTVFRDCKSGPDLVREYNATLNGGHPTGDSQLSTQNATR